MTAGLRATSIVTLAAWLSAVVATTAPALAQPGTSPAPPPAPLPSPPQPPMPPPPPVADAQALYELAFAALLTSDLVSARARFAVVVEQAADPELRGAARQMLRLVDELSARQGRLVFGPAGPGGAEGPERPIRDQRDDDDDEGRVGVVVTTTLASIYAGVVFADLADTGDARAITGIITATTGLGFVASLYGTRGKTIHGGTAEAYSLGLMLGAGNGLLLASPLGAESSEQWQTTVLGGMAVTAAAGYLYGQSAHPTRAQVSVAGTMATMGIATVGLGLVITLPDLEADSILLAMTAGLDGGAAAGLYLGRDLTWSTGRARLVWLGALLGGLAGVATGVIVIGGGGDDDTEGRIVAGLTLGGAWGGLGLAAHLTRHMRPDARFRTAAASDRMLTPIAVPHGAGLGYVGRW